MDETTEEDVVEEVKEQIIEEPIVEPSQNAVAQGSATSEPIRQSLSFNEIDSIRNNDGTISNVVVSKSIPHLEEISEKRALQRRMENDDDDEQHKLNISEQSFTLDDLEVHNIVEPQIELLPDLIMDEEIEVLD
jgi:hypothetical protein